MKKILLSFIACVALISGAFAREQVTSDVQLNLGFTDLKIDQSTKMGSEKAEAKTSGENFSIDLQSWTFINKTDWFGFGFKIGMNYYVGTLIKTHATENVGGTKSENDYYYDKNTSSSLRLIVGPAASFTFNDIIQLNCSIDFAISLFDKYVLNTKDGISYQPGFGFGTEIQAKFLPNKKFSPVVGYRATFIAPLDAIPIDNGKLQKNEKSNARDSNMWVTTQAIYIGGAYNF